MHENAHQSQHLGVLGGFINPGLTLLTESPSRGRSLDPGEARELLHRGCVAHQSQLVSRKGLRSVVCPVTPFSRGRL